jgi:hypothetical protein
MNPANQNLKFRITRGTSRIYFACVKDGNEIIGFRGPYTLPVAKRFRTKAENQDHNVPRIREYIICTIDSLSEI